MSKEVIFIEDEDTQNIEKEKQNVFSVYANSFRIASGYSDTIITLLEQHPDGLNTLGRVRVSPQALKELTNRLKEIVEDYEKEYGPIPQRKANTKKVVKKVVKKEIN
ncbi:DUF3467 domain-containing protein [Aneurinibacillus aneurinilyticus]|uniref:DUF3467 domain-containing protein n=1 Tax=Aneurinibacillus aneurinilyticus ATCC 12856 TaxID=649747 RepID=U1WQN2_ANEAE|nr:DUF3467 domain-containing protein [Aneurinibacillus aneurinilyticus]ERI10909.1 hypothetical protein HMPREF0083_01021 [Aneurinibacillus aneurinilyticus ATCC 12856]MED0704933.1 DUF3467 domain-containing protein [Aneurinibacillus aneurinilyticus]MED0723073.1 DUF3467 domain-containing protein [Aneurinibacillus aneurinilyticus]MED0731454.1 DUF3467 domain-containing protein [Aneurinibacillus aneurinilyticus]MED0740077.1 DUF3467 domain-containing protein [Aneurinibacillus aneurinilyticus]